LRSGDGKSGFFREKNSHRVGLYQAGPGEQKTEQGTEKSSDILDKNGDAERRPVRTFNRTGALPKKIQKKKNQRVQRCLSKEERDSNP